MGGAAHHHRHTHRPIPGIKPRDYIKHIKTAAAPSGHAIDIDTDIEIEKAFRHSPESHY